MMIRATAQRLNFEERIVINLHNLAALRYDQKRYDEAKTLLDEALQIAQREKIHRVALEAITGIAVYRARQGESAQSVIQALVWAASG